MRTKSIARLATLLAAAWLIPAAAMSQQQADALAEAQRELTAQARAELSRRLDRDAIRDNSSSNPDGASFVESATAVRGWSLAINGSSTFDSFRFPITLSSSLAQLTELGGRPAFSTGRLRNSQLSVTYTPIEVGTKEVQRPGGSDTELKTQSGKKTVASYKISLSKLRDVQELDAEVAGEIAKAFFQVAPRFQDPNNQNLVVDKDRLLEEVRTVVEPRIKEIVTTLKRKLDQRWKWSGKLDYIWVSGDPPDQHTLTLLGGREGFGSAKHPVGVGTTLAWTRSRENKFLNAFDVATVGGAIGAVLKEGIDLRLEAQFNRFSGDGFAGIPGVLDHTANSEVNFAESLVFKIAGGQKLALTLKQLHLTTGDTDIALVTGFGYSF